MFATHRVATFAATAIAATGLGLAAFAGAGTAGADPLDLGDEILANTDLTTHQAAVFVVESVFNYCPEHTALLP